MKPLISMIFAAFFMLHLSIPAQAAEAKAIALPLTQVSDDSSVRVRYTLSPLSDEAPMPRSSEKGIYSFELCGSDEIVLSDIDLSCQGKWDYILKAECSGGRVSPSEVTVTVTVTQSAEPIAAAFLPNGTKCELRFTATPDPVTTASSGEIRSDSPKTGDYAHTPAWISAGMAFGISCIASRKKREQ